MNSYLNNKVVFGEDCFTGWFSSNASSEDERLSEYKKTIEKAYDCGVRTYTCALHQGLIEVLKDFKNKNKDIVCIANPQWANYYYINGHSLWVEYYKNKCLATITKKIKSKVQAHWIRDINLKDGFSDDNVKAIYLKKSDVYKAIGTLNFCDYFVVGNLWYDFLFYINRIDIIEQEISIVKQFGKIPIGIISGGSLPLNIIYDLGLSCSLIWINKYYSFPNIKETLEGIKHSKIPLIAYRIFENPNGFNCLDAINFIRKLNNVKSILIGANNNKQAEETLLNIKKSIKNGKFGVA